MSDGMKAITWATVLIWTVILTFFFMAVAIAAPILTPAPKIPPKPICLYHQEPIYSSPGQILQSTWLHCLADNDNLTMRK